MIVELINDIGCDFAPTEADFQIYANAASKEINIQANTVCITLIDEEESASLNNQYRNKNYPTNVLSFHYDPIPGITESDLLGDLALCPSVIQKEAADQEKTLSSHFAHMTIHGILHLAGYDHIDEKEAIVMEALETKILSTLGFENPYDIK